MFSLRKQGIGMAGPDKICLEPGDVPIPPAPIVTQQVFVSAIFGSDVTGTGDPSTPYATVTHALGTILDASLTKVYEVVVLPGTYTEAVALKAFTVLTGSDDSQTTGGFLLSRITGNFTLDPATFGGAPVGQSAFVTNIDIDGLLTLDYVGIVSPTGAVYFTNCNCEANAAITQGSSNETEFHGCTLFGDCAWSGGFGFFYNTNGINDTAVLSLLTGTLTAFGGGWSGSVNLDQNGTIADTIINSHGFSMSRGNVNIITTTARSPAINANIGDLPENCNMSGANAVLSAQMRISHQFVDIAPNPTAIAGVTATIIPVGGGTVNPPFAAVTTISLPVPAGLIGATNIETMQCSCSPVGANWGTFIGPHNCSVTVTYRMNGGVPNVDVNISNPGLAFNITDLIDLNFEAYLPSVL